MSETYYVRLFKNTAGEINYLYMDEITPDFNVSSYIDLTEKEVLSMLNDGCHDLQNVYCEGEFCKANLKIDKEWVRTLMPWKLIKKKHVARLQKKLDLELAKNDPNPVICIKLQRELDVIKNASLTPNGRSFEEVIARRNEEILKYYEQALKNLDEDGHDKPIIRQKLLELINNPLKK